MSFESFEWFYVPFQVGGSGVPLCSGSDLPKHVGLWPFDNVQVRTTRSLTSNSSLYLHFQGEGAREGLALPHSKWPCFVVVRKSAVHSAACSGSLGNSTARGFVWVPRWAPVSTTCTKLDRPRGPTWATLQGFLKSDAKQRLIRWLFTRSYSCPAWFARFWSPTYGSPFWSYQVLHWQFITDFEPGLLSWPSLWPISRYWHPLKCPSVVWHSSPSPTFSPTQSTSTWMFPASHFNPARPGLGTCAHHL